MPRIYRRDCDNCGHHYTGVGKKYCSPGRGIFNKGGVMIVTRNTLRTVLREVLYGEGSTDKSIVKLKEEIAELKLQKKMEEREIKQLVKMKQEEQELTYKKREVELEKEWAVKERKLMKEYYDKTNEKMEKIYAEILQRLPDVTAHLEIGGKRK